MNRDYAKMSRILLFVVLCGMFGSVHGWGAAGHSFIARLAQSQLNDAASDWIEYLVPWHWYGNLSAMASWGDTILYPDTNPTGYDNWQWTRPLHFINTPDWACTYNVNRDCIGDICVDGAIRNYTKRLQTRLDDIQHQEALYFLIHYVGDIHQPLHTGFTSDYGGNNVRGFFMNITTYQTNLHSLWDSGMITRRLQQDFSSNTTRYYEHIYNLMLNQTSAENDDDIEQWIQENLKYVCEEIYFDDDNRLMNSSIRFNLGGKYYNRNIGIVEKRLAQGGRRLGALLNRLAETRPQKSSKDKLYMVTYTLAVIVWAGFILTLG